MPFQKISLKQILKFLHKVFSLVIIISIPVLLIYFIFSVTILGSLFYLYFGIVIIIIILRPFFTSKKDLSRLASEHIIKESTLIDKLRIALSKVLNLHYYIIWPLLLITPYPSAKQDTNKKYTEYTASLISFTKFSVVFPDVFISVGVAFLLSFFLLNLKFNDEDLKYINFIIWALLIHITLKHVAYIATSKSLPETLRQSQGSPYLRFITIAASDILSLSIIYGLLKNNPFSVDITYQKIFVTSKEILSIQDNFKIFLNQKVPFAQNALRLSGILYYVIIAKTFFQIKSFKRTDEDYLNLGMNYLRIGKYQQGLNLLNRIRKKTDKAFRAEAFAYIGLGNLEKSIKNIKKYLSISQENYNNYLEDNIIIVVCQSITSICPPEETIYDFILYVSEKKVSNSSLSFLITNIQMIYHKNSYEKLKNLLSDKKLHVKFLTSIAWNHHVKLNLELKTKIEEISDQSSNTRKDTTEEIDDLLDDLLSEFIMNLEIIENELYQHTPRTIDDKIFFNIFFIDIFLKRIAFRAAFPPILIHSVEWQNLIDDINNRLDNISSLIDELEADAQRYLAFCWIKIIDVEFRNIDFYNEDINELRSKMFDLISKLIETTDEFDTKEMFKNFQNFATIGEI